MERLRPVVGGAIVDIWKGEIGENLLPLQVEAVQTGLLFGTRNLVVAAPTSSGKTFIGEAAAVAEAFKGHRTLYLVPLKYLAEEKYADFSRKYHGFGLSIIMSTGDNREHDFDIVRGNYHIAFVVFEKLYQLLVTNPGLLKNCGLVIIDELQMIGDPNRGLALEFLITRVRQGEVRLIGLSAVLGNPEDVAKWLDAELISSSTRPAELLHGVYHDGRFAYREFNSGSVGEETIGGENLSGPTIEETTDNLARHLADAGEQVLVFARTKTACVNIARRLAGKLDYGAASRAIAALEPFDSTLSKDSLMECLRRGIAFHNADMLPEERRVVEASFKRGEVHILVSTTTLAMGANLPASTVLIPDPHQPIGNTLIQAKDYHNMAGRAGRFGLHASGRAILIAQSDFLKHQMWAHLVLAPPEKVESQLSVRSSSSHILALIASNFCDTPEQINSFLKGTFGFEQLVDHPSAEDLDRSVQEIVNQAVAAALAVSQQGKLAVTPLGKVCASGGISIPTAANLINWLQGLNEEVLPAVHEVVYAAIQSSELRPLTYGFSTPEYNSGVYVDTIRDAVAQDPDKNAALHRFLQAYRRDYELQKPLKAVAFAADWVQGVASKQLETRYSMPVGAIKGFCEQLAWIVDTTASLAEVSEAPAPVISHLSEISELLSYGVRLEALFLAKARVQGLFRDNIMRLTVAPGAFHSVDEILNADRAAFEGIVSKTLASNIQSQLTSRMEDTYHSRWRIHKLRVQQANRDTQGIDALYEAQGKAFERAVYNAFHEAHITCELISDQANGEPDLILYDGPNKLVIQVTASENPAKLIKYSKTSEVLAGGAQYNPNAYGVIGRPDFDNLAIRTAMDMSRATNVSNFKLIPLYVLAELYVSCLEGKLSAPGACELLFRYRGYLDRRVLLKELATING